MGKVQYEYIDLLNECTSKFVPDSFRRRSLTHNNITIYNINIIIVAKLTAELSIRHKIIYFVLSCLAKTCIEHEKELII